MQRETVPYVILVVAFVALLLGAAFVVMQDDDEVLTGDEPIIQSFNDCLAAGYAVFETYPRQCKTPDGRSFTEIIGNELEKVDLIRLTHPRPNQIIKSPLEVSGQARGTWFFEASFPVRLEDARGNVLVQTYATALDEWMTESFVPFETVIEFDARGAKSGLLILEKDNPSGLPEHADVLYMPVRFR